MRYYDFSKSQLEEKAEELLLEFDEERLYRTKPIDVYAVIEKCLDVPYDWKYLTPDQSTLGATAFSSGYMYVWPKPYYLKGMLPYPIYVEKGTILIDSTLTEGDNRGRENFTVMHEVFHQVLHKKCFRDMPEGYVHPTYSRTIDGDIKYDDYAMSVIEQQANACAAAFLMPRELVTSTFKSLCNTKKYNWHGYVFVPEVIDSMSKEFNVSKTAMRYRLENIGLIKNWEIRKNETINI